MTFTVLCAFRCLFDNPFCAFPLAVVLIGYALTIALPSAVLLIGVTAGGVTENPPPSGNEGAYLTLQIEESERRGGGPAPANAYAAMVGVAYLRAT